MFKNSSKVLNEENFNPDYHIGDGLQLNQKGYAIWVKYLKRGISDLSVFHTSNKSEDK